MRINVFEGARRIALLLGVAATLATLVVTAMYTPYMSLTYNIAFPGAPLLKTDEICPRDAASHYITTETKSGRSLGVTLCLLPQAFGEEKQMLIPYTIDKSGTIWGAASYSDEVTAYERELEKRFALPPADETAIEREIADRYKKNWLTSLGGLAIGLTIYWMIVWAIGWVTRGFAGIPRGKDNRPTEAA